MYSNHVTLGCLTAASSCSVLPLAPNGPRVPRPTLPAAHDVLAAQVQDMLEREQPLPVSIDCANSGSLALNLNKM